MKALGGRFIYGKYIVGYWAWELPQVPRDWNFGVPFVHEVWVPSTFTAEAIRPITGGRPVRVVPHPVTVPGGTRATWIEAGRPFTVLTIFNALSSVARKNPFAVIDAFKTAFGDDRDARLVIKALNMAHAPLAMRQRLAAEASPNITLIDHVMSEADLEALYAKSDVLVSLHRSEGFGLTVAEAMARGLAVISTDWSGTVDFLTPDRGVPVLIGSFLQRTHKIRITSPTCDGQSPILALRPML